jgi:hypothetical protein
MKLKIRCCGLLVALFGLITPPGERAEAQRQGDTLSWHLHTSAMGMVRGQTLRIGVFNLGLQRQSPSVGAVVRLLDTRGNVIAQTDETTLPHGQIYYFDFRRDALPLTGGTPDRLQFRAVVDLRVNRLELSEDPRNPSAGVIPSFEFLDQVTGQTLPTGDIRTVISASASYASANAGIW